MEAEQILSLIEAVSKSTLTGFKYEEKGVKLSLQKETVNVTAPVQTVGNVVPTVSAAALAEPKTENPEGNIVKSPLVGTFYAAPSEDAEPFVKVGDRVEQGQTLGIVEAMKLMNDIESEFSGTIAEIYVSNAEAVEYGQPLFRIQ